jgi:hypothetical protein
MLFLTFFLGCSKDEPDATAPPGSLSLSWTIGATDCEAAGLADVAVAIDDGDLATFACSSGTGTVPDVAPGRYDLRVLGRETGGIDRYGADVADVVVESGADTPLGNVTLSALPAPVTVSWVFADGGLCAQNDVETVHVRLFDAGDFLGHEGEAPCTDGILVVEQVTGGTWTVDVEGISAADATTRTGEADVVVEPGTPVDVRVTLGA